MPGVSTILCSLLCLSHGKVSVALKVLETLWSLSPYNSLCACGTYLLSLAAGGMGLQKQSHLHLVTRFGSSWQFPPEIAAEGHKQPPHFPKERLTQGQTAAVLLHSDTCPPWWNQWHACLLLLSEVWCSPTELASAAVPKRQGLRNGFGTLCP